MSHSTSVAIYRLIFGLLACVLIVSAAQADDSKAIPPRVMVLSGAINTVAIKSGDKQLAVYGSSSASQPPDLLLLTHHRRDVLSYVDVGAGVPDRIAAPAAEREWISQPELFWAQYPKSRFHDYACKTAKIVTLPLSVSQWVKPGDTITWQDLSVQVLDLAGPTTGSIGYMTEIDGKRIAFTGDLILAGGKLADLYSLQDAIPTADIRGYHGYAGRLGDLVSSLKRLAALKPDVIVPVRGPVITDPQKDIALLIDRVQRLYANYLSTNALHWYFREERMKKCAARVLDSTDGLELMPFAHHEKAPEWVVENATSRLIVSDSGRAFLIDCGYDRVIEAVQKMIDTQLISGVDGIFVTHYHDDHTDRVQAAAEKFHCPVYALNEYADILSRPHAYRMPAMTDIPIQNIQSLTDGHSMKWHEYDLSFHFFPGQAIYHGGLLVRRHGEAPIFFIGDSFAPSGMDDYCLLNRNLVGPKRGYNYCLDKLRSFSEPMQLVNEHIPFVFQFTAAELKQMTERYEARTRILQELFPWDSPDYGLDEQWAAFYPYEAKIEKQEADTSLPKTLSWSVRVNNHSPAPRLFTVRLRMPKGFDSTEANKQIKIEAGGVADLPFELTCNAEAGVHVITADILSEGMEFHDFIEGLVTVP
ncbi:MAG: MBL fold metallo-hydrolase [Pirellulales bacterium]